MFIFVSIQNKKTMKLFRIFLTLMAGFIIFVSCSTGRSAYRKGNYYDATMQAVQHLRLKPSSTKAIETIRNSYPMAIQYNQQLIDQLLISSSPDKYATVVGLYQQLNQLADEITRCPAALDVVRPVVYFHEQLRDAKNLAAKEQFDEGVRLLKNGILEDARLANSCFEKVKQFDPTYPEVDNMILSSEDLGTLKVVVEQIPVNSLNYQVSAKVFYDRMFNYLKRSVQRKFLTFYQSSDAEELRINPHHIIRMQFYDFSIGNVRDHEVEKEYTSDSLVVGTYTDNDGIKHDVRNVVKANLVTHDREVLSKGIFEIRIIDFNANQNLSDRSFPGEYVWQNSWATYNGDQRALPSDKLKLVGQKQLSPPTPQELFLLFSDPIFSNSSSFLGSFYRKR